jgi:hypothetical protein
MTAPGDGVALRLPHGVRHGRWLGCSRGSQGFRSWHLGRWCSLFGLAFAWCHACCSVVLRQCGRGSCRRLQGR